MLSLGPGSTCDVCLEPFGQDLKAPYSIHCGHVFCLDCLNHLRPVICPLCRIPFEPGSFIKLHIDVDSISLEHRAVNGQDSDEVEREARRLHASMASVVNSGSGEAPLRQLIDECMTFVHAHKDSPWHQYLRVTSRTMKYLHEVKLQLKDEIETVRSLEKTIAELESQKEQLTKRVEDLLARSRDDRETALAVEMSLREHYGRTREAYDEIYDRYKFIVAEWGRLNEEHNRRPADARSQELKSTAIDSPSVASADRTIRKGKGKADSGFFISPMPPLTPLPVSSEAVAPPPDSNDHITQELAILNRPLGLLCGKQHCPFNCDCAPLPVFPRSPSLSFQAPQHTAPSPTSSSPNLTRTPHIPEPEVRVSPPEAQSLVRDSEPTPTPIRGVRRTPGGLSLTAPIAEADRSSSRSRSFSSQPPAESSSVSTYPSSPVRTPERNTTSIGSLAPESSNYNVPQEHLRSRLHDILSSPTTSTSLPNLSGGHFPATPKSNLMDSRRDTLPTSRSTPSALPVLQSQATSQPIPIRGPVDHQFASINVSAPAPGSNASSSTSGSGMSHASSAAFALEQAQKELRRAEKERQRAQQNNIASQSLEVSGTSSSTSSTSRPGVSRSSSRRDYGNSTSASSSLPRESSVTSVAAAASRPHAVYIPSSLKPSSTSYISSAYATQQNLTRYPSTTSTKSKVSTAMTGNGNVGLYA